MDSRRSEKRSRTRSSIQVAILILTGFAFLPTGAGQTEGPNLFIIEIEPVGKLVVDASNSILVRLGNNGSLQNSGTIRLEVTSCNGAPMKVIIGETAFEPVEPGGKAAVEFRWDGRMEAQFGGGPRDPVSGHCQFTAFLRTVIQEADTRDHEKSRSAFVEYYAYSIEVGDVRNHEAGAVADQYFAVRSLGNVRDTIRVELRNPTPKWQFWLPNEQLDTTPGSVSPQQRLFAKIPEGALAGDEGKVEVRVHSFGNPGGADASKALTFQVLGKYRHRLFVQDPEGEFTSGARMVIPLTLRNEADADNISLTIGSFDELRLSQASVRPTVVAVEEGSSATANLEVALRPDPEAGAAVVKVVSFSHGNPRIQAQANITVHVRQEHGVTARLGESMPTFSRLRAGDQLTVTIQVANTGNGLDRYRIVLLDASAAWGPTVDLPDAAIPPRRSANLSFEFAVPPGEPAATHRLRFFVQSVADDRARAEVSVPVEVQSKPNVGLSDLKPVAILDDAGWANASFSVTNTGNAGGSYVVRAELEPEKGSPAEGWLVGIDTPVKELSPGQRFRVNVSVRAPAGQTEGARGVLHVAVRPGDDAPESHATILVSKLRANIVIGAVEARPPIVRFGDAVEVSVQIANVGQKSTDRPFDVTFSLLQSATGAEVASRVLRVEPLDWISGGNSTSFTVAFPTADLRGAYRVVVRADSRPPAGEIPELSEADNGRSTEFRVWRGSVRVEAPPPILVSPGGMARGEGDGAFRIVSESGERLNVSYQVLSERSWLGSGYEGGLVLAPRDVSLVGFEIRVPAEPLHPGDVIRLVVRVEGPLGFRAGNETVLTVDDRSAPVILSAETEPAQAILGHPFHIQVTIHDEVGVREAKVRIRLPSGAEETLPLVRGAGDRRIWSAITHLDELGEYSFVVRAVDNSSRSNSVESGTVLPPVRTMASGTPVLRLLEPQPALAIKPGTALPVKVVDVRPIVRAWATMGSSNVTLAATNPLRVPTGGMPDGPATIVVFAENDLGAIGRSSLSLRFDAAAPKILDPQVEFELDPLTGQLSLRFTARIPDSDVIRVWLDLKPLNGDPVRVELSRNQSAAYSEIVNVTSTTVEWSITAVDAAGNIAVYRPGEGSADYDAPAGSAPAPGWLVLVAAGTIWLWVRRRGQRAT